MLKKLDKFVLSRFLGPFILAYSVVTFIFLIQHLLKYFKHFVGKGLGWEVFAELFGHFSVMLTPVALPLAVLLSALMSFGSLGEHSELTAIKSAGISLMRILMPVAIFVAFLTGWAVYFNDVLSPEANLNAFSLLYDIKQKKPTMDLKESAFYNGLPGYSIWIDGKGGEEDQDLYGVKIYNHTARQGNSDIIMAERGRMYTMNNDNYLVLELINGRRYTNIAQERGRVNQTEYLQNVFDSSRIVFSMESFGLKETEKDLFKGHNMMKTANQLRGERDSLNFEAANLIAGINTRVKAYYNYQFERELEIVRQAEAKQRAIDSMAVVSPETPVLPTAGPDSAQLNAQAKYPRPSIPLSTPKTTPVFEEFIWRRGTAPQDYTPEMETPKAAPSRKDSILAATVPVQNTGAVIQGHNARVLRKMQEKRKQREEGGLEEEAQALPAPAGIGDSWRYVRNYRVLNMAWSKANGIKVSVDDVLRRMERQELAKRHLEVELQNKYARAMAVFIMFLIGAPLGAIIKKGGLGVPILISILFFIIYYITTITGTKLANSMIVPTVVGCWGGDFLLLLCGIFFLRQAYYDSRLLDSDMYLIAWDKLMAYLSKYRKKGDASAQQIEQA